MQIDRPITISILIFVIVVLAFFLVVPEYNAFKDLQIQLAEKKAEHDAQFAYYAEIKKTHNTLQAHTDDLKKIDSALPQDPALNKIVYFLQYVIDENGLILKSLFLSKSSSGANNPNAVTIGDVKEIVFSVDLLGDYSSLENLIIALEKSSRIFEVTSISFGGSAGSGAGGGKVSQNFSLQIKTYSY
ncbi:MAG: hypothetical protein WCK10_01575 [Candidatus Staskawiczbacteria bacterium]